VKLQTAPLYAGADVFNKILTKHFELMTCNRFKIRVIDLLRLHVTDFFQV